MACQWPPKKNTAFRVYFSLYNAATGAVVGNPGTYTRGVSIDGGAIDTTPVNAITEEDTTYGQLSWLLDATEMNGDAIWISCTDDTDNTIPFTCTLYTTAGTWDDLSTDAEVGAAVRDVAIAGAAASSVGEAIAAVLTDTGTTIPAQITALTEGGMKKNVEKAAFPIYMVLSSDHVTAATGKTVAVAISKDGGAFGAATNTPATEVSGGFYKITLAAADVNCDTLAIKATSADCDATAFSILTSA